MKAFFTDAEVRWNRIIGVLGAPIVAFVMVDWAIAQFGTEDLVVFIAFCVAMLITANSLLEGALEGIIGCLVLSPLRPMMFRASIMGTPFDWWGHTSACAAVAVALLVATILFLFRKANQGK